MDAHGQQQYSKSGLVHESDMISGLLASSLPWPWTWPTTDSLPVGKLRLKMKRIRRNWSLKWTPPLCLVRLLLAATARLRRLCLCVSVCSRCVSQLKGCVYMYVFMLRARMCPHLCKLQAYYIRVAADTAFSSSSKLVCVCFSVAVFQSGSAS